MANKNQYRGSNGRFERCTVEKAFGIQINSRHEYRCLTCGHVFMPILEEGACSKCGSTEKEMINDLAR